MGATERKRGIARTSSSTMRARRANSCRIASTCGRLRSESASTIADGQSFAEALLAEVHVAVVPGADFGECAADHVRITFACDEATIRKGMARIAEFTAALR